MRFSILILVLMLRTTSWANTNLVDLSLLQDLPRLKAEAIKRAEPTQDDSTAAIDAKCEEYYLALTNMVQSVRSHYYFHEDFPTNLTAGLEEHAIVLAGIQYPLGSVTGCSGYDALIMENKIKLAEDLVCNMVQAIYETAYWDKYSRKPSKPGLKRYRTWFKQWDAKKSNGLR